MEKDSEVKRKDANKFSFKKKKKKSIKSLLLIILMVMTFGVGIYTGITEPWGKLNPFSMIADRMKLEKNSNLSISTLEKIIQPASDLLTSKYRYKDVDIYENYKQLFGKKIPFTTDMTVFTYEGSVGVGIDLLDVEYEIDNENRLISIFIPELKILSNEIDYDSFNYPFKTNSIFNSTDMSDFTELISTLKEEKEKIVLNDKEFMDSARRNAQLVLKGFLTTSDATKNFTVIFK